MRTLIKLDMSAVGRGQASLDQRFNGDTGYAIDSLQGNREITGNQLDNLKSFMFPTPFLNYKDRGATLEFVRKDKVGDRDANVILLKPKAGSTAQYFIDAQSNLIVKIVAVPQAGGDIQQTTELSDYRDVDGLKLPFRTRTSSIVQTYTVNVTKIEHNVAIDESLFSKP